MGQRNKFKVALSYSQLLNWSVLPLHSIVNGKCTCNKDNCPSPGKHPFTKNGVKSATTDTVDISNWFTKYPYLNIGIATGKVSGIFVMDVDLDKNGHLTLDDLIHNYGPLPDTVHAITGSGGSHYLFKYQEGIGNKVDILPGIDIRGDGGYIVVPPSKHISGRQYEWELSSRPYVNPIVDAPQWLLDKIINSEEGKSKRKPSSYWAKIIRGVDEGKRNSTAASMVGYLLRRYVDPIMVVEIMHLWNERNNPPLEKDELNKIIDSIARKELSRRRGNS